MVIVGQRQVYSGFSLAGLLVLGSGLGNSVVKSPPANAGDAGVKGLISGLGRPPGGGHGNPLQYSCLEDPMDRGAWRGTVYGLAKSRTRLSPSLVEEPIQGAKIWKYGTPNPLEMPQTRCNWNSHI